jgi:hypothetical protein
MDITGLIVTWAGAEYVLGELLIIRPAQEGTGKAYAAAEAPPPAAPTPKPKWQPAQFSKPVVKEKPRLF